MAYITPEELVPPGHSGRSFLEGFTSEEKARACEEASGTADSYFPARFGIPLPNPNSETKRRVRHVAIYDLVCGRGLNPETPGHQTIIVNYENAIRWFEQCAAGKAMPTTTEDATPNTEEGGPTCTSEEPRGW